MNTRPRSMEDDEQRKDLTSRIVGARDSFSEYFAGKEVQGSRNERVGGRMNRDGVRYDFRHQTGVNDARAEIISKYGKKPEASTGNEYGLSLRGRENITVAVIFDEGRDNKGRVRVTVNDFLVTTPRACSIDEVGRALDLYTEIGKYFESRAESIGFHHAKDGSPQKRYLMKE